MAISCLSGSGAGLEPRQEHPSGSAPDETGTGPHFVPMVCRWRRSCADDRAKTLTGLDKVTSRDAAIRTDKAASGVGVNFEPQKQPIDLAREAGFILGAIEVRPATREAVAGG